MTYGKLLLRLILPLSTVAIGLTACEKTEVPALPSDLDVDLVDPSDANAIAGVLILPPNAERLPGAAPPPTGTSASPRVGGGQSLITSANGASATVDFEFDNAGNGLGGCYVQVEGASGYVRVPYTAGAQSVGRLQLPLGIPTNVAAGSFRVAYCVYDRNGNVSNVQFASVDVLRLGSGTLQVSLTWDAANDQDLYVDTPGGATISYASRSGDGGELDRDDTDGYGPENVFWEDAAPDGTYEVRVNDYSGSGANYTVTVSAAGVSRSFSGRTSDGSTSRAVAFVKSGSSIRFQ